MLQKLNERIQGLVAWVIISLIAVTFALFGIDYYIQSRQTSMTAVEVNGNTISKQDVELQYRRMRQAQDPAKVTAASDAQLKQQVLEQLIVNEISVEAAKEQGFQVTPAQANAAILSIPQFQEDGQFSPNRYQQAISGALFTPDSFNKQVQQGMLLNQQRFAIIGTSFTLPSEVDRFVKLYFQTRDYGYMLLPASQFINEQQVTSEEIKSYYDKHQKDFISPEQVSLEYVELSVKDIRNEVQVTDQQAQQYYEANQANFLTPAKWTVSHILIGSNDKQTEAELKALQEKAQQVYEKAQSKPEQFSDLAKQYSDDAISAAKGGALPTITAGQSDFDKYLVKLKKPGQVTEPVKTEHGYEIFQLTTYQPAEVKPFEQVKKQIVEQLKADTVQNLFAKRLEELTDLSYQTPDSLQLAASEIGLTIKSTGLFTSDGGQSPITKNPEVIRRAFSHDVLELENNSSPIQLNNNTIIVIRVKDHIKSKQKPLAEVSKEIKSLVAKTKAAQKAKSVGKELVAAAKDKKQFIKLKEQYQLKWEKVSDISRDADSVPTEINELAFSIANPNTVTGKLIKNDEFVIVKLDRVTDGAMSQLDDERKDSIEEQLESNYGIMDYDLYVSGLLKKADIKRQSS